MTDEKKDENEKTDDNEDEKESISNPKKLKDTSRLHLGNHFEDKTIKEYDFINKSTTCIYCPICKCIFSSDFEFKHHKCK